MGFSRYIYLLDRGDFDRQDGQFWTNLFMTIPSEPEFENLTFGQLAHIFFPNFKYVCKIDITSSGRGLNRQNDPPNASVYLSDQNVIQKCDTTALRKLIYDIPAAYHGRKVHLQQPFTARELHPAVEVDRLNRPDVVADAAHTQDAINRPQEHFGRRASDVDVIQSNGWIFRVLLESLVARNAAVFSLGRKLFIHLHVLANTPIPRQEVGVWMRRRVIDILWLVRRTAEEERGTNKVSRAAMTMDTDFQPRQEPYDCPDIERVARWMHEVSLSFCP